MLHLLKKAFNVLGQTSRSNLKCRIDERNVLEPIRHPICTFENCFVSYEAVEVKKAKLGYYI